MRHTESSLSITTTQSGTTATTTEVTTKAEVTTKGNKISATTEEKSMETTGRLACERTLVGVLSAYLGMLGTGYFV